MGVHHYWTRLICVIILENIGEKCKGVFKFVQPLYEAWYDDAWGQIRFTQKLITKLSIVQFRPKKTAVF